MHLTLISNNVDPFSTSNDNDFFLDLSTSLMGQHLILRNISLLNTVYTIESIEIPTELHSLNDLIRQHFPLMNISSKKTKYVLQSKIDQSINSKEKSSDTTSITKLKDPTLSTVRISCNSILHLDKKGEVLIEEINYPWDFLKIVQEVLNDEVNSTKIIKGKNIENKYYRRALHS